MSHERRPTVSDLIAARPAMTEPDTVDEDYPSNPAEVSFLLAPLDKDFVMGALDAALKQAPEGSRFRADVERSRLATMSSQASDAAATVMYAGGPDYLPDDTPRARRRRERQLDLRKRAAAIHVKSLLESPDFPRLSQRAQSQLILAAMYL